MRNLKSMLVSRHGHSAALSLNFLGVSSIDPRITFTRATPATRFNAQGMLETKGLNQLLYSTWAGATGAVGSAPTGWGGAGIYGNNPIQMLNEYSVDGSSAVARIINAGPTGIQGITRLANAVDGMVISTPYIISVYVRTIAGVTPADLLLYFGNGTPTQATLATAATLSALTPGVWTRYSTSVTFTVVPNNFTIGTANGTTGNGFDITCPQIEQSSTLSAYSPTTTAANSAPRFDYDPATLLPKGLLIEEARTNSCLWSESFDNAVWTKTSITVAANSALAPTATVVADTLTASGASGTCQQAVTTTAALWTFSVYLKRLTGSGVVNISMDGTTWVAQTINSTTWTRCTVTQTCLAGTSNPGIQLVTSGDAVYAFGGQAELGAFGTSYIPTTTTSATRNADSAVMTGTNFSSWFNAAAGTAIVEGDYGAASTAPRAWAEFGTPAANGYIFYLNTATNPAAYAGTSLTSFSTKSPNTPIKTAIAYDGVANSASCDGVAAQAITPVVAVTAPDRLYIGQWHSGGMIGGHIRSIRYFNTRLTDAQLQAQTV